MAEVGFEVGLRHSQRAAPIREVESALDSRQCPTGVRQPVLAKLGRLDRGDDGRPARAVCQRLPGLKRVDRPAHATQEMRPVDPDPHGVPRSVEGLSPIPVDGRRASLRTAAEVRAPPWRPPGFLGNGYR